MKDKTGYSPTLSSHREVQSRFKHESKVCNLASASAKEPIADIHKDHIPQHEVLNTAAALGTNARVHVCVILGEIAHCTRDVLTRQWAQTPVHSSRLQSFTLTAPFPRSSLTFPQFVYNILGLLPGQTEPIIICRLSLRFQFSEVLDLTTIFGGDCGRMLPLHFGEAVDNEWTRVGGDS